MAKVIYVKTGLGGMDPRTATLLQLAALVEIDGKLCDGAYWKVMPTQGKACEDSAVAYNGFMDLAPEVIAREFKDVHDVHREFTALLGRFIDKFGTADKAHLVGWAPRMDDDALSQFFEDRGDKFYRSWFWTPSVDVQAIAAQVFIDHRASLADFKLATVAKRYGIESPVPLADSRGFACTARRLHHRLMNKPDPGPAPWGV